MVVSPLGTPELDDMQNWEDTCYEEEEEEDDLTFLEYCDIHNLDPEEQMYYEKADIARDTAMDR